jgi:hypothetical protein
MHRLWRASGRAIRSELNFLLASYGVRADAARLCRVRPAATVWQVTRLE